MTEKLKATIESTADLLTNKLSTVIWRFVILVTIGLAVNTWSTEVGLREKQGLKVDRHAEQIRSLELCVMEKFAKKADLVILKSNTVTKHELSALQDDIKDVKKVVDNMGVNINDIKFFMGRVTQFMETKDRNGD